MSVAVAGVWAWTAWVIRVVAQIAIVVLAGVLVYKGRSARPWVYLSLLAAVGVAIATIIAGVLRWNTPVEEYLAIFLLVGLLVAAAPVVLLWGLVASCRRRTADWQALVGGSLSFLVMCTTWFTFVGDG